MPAITSPGARPAAEPLPRRHRQPAHTTPARLRRHEVKLTGRSDITAVAGKERAGPRGGRFAARSAAADTQVSNFTAHEPPFGEGFWLLPTSPPSALIWVICADGMEHLAVSRQAGSGPYLGGHASPDPAMSPASSGSEASWSSATRHTVCLAGGHSAGSVCSEAERGQQAVRTRWSGVGRSASSAFTCGARATRARRTRRRGRGSRASVRPCGL
jgi:hypothetical protein